MQLLERVHMFGAVFEKPLTYTYALIIAVAKNSYKPHAKTAVLLHLKWGVLSLDTLQLRYSTPH